MSKVVNSSKPTLKTILKQHHFNINRAQMNKYSCMQIFISVHMDRFVYIQKLRICKLKFALVLNQVQILRISIWCKFCICVQIHSVTDLHMWVYLHICKYLRTYANLSMWTTEREVGGSKPTAAVLCPWARHFTPRKYWLITQEAVAPSRHDWKIVDWDVKPQHKQTKCPCESTLSLISSHFAKISSLHAYAQYIWMVYAKYQKASTNALVRVDFPRVCTI